jgi:hypothetical protein
MVNDGPLGHTKHVVRAALLLVLVVAALVLGRAFFVPDSWGEHGWYRGDAVAEHRAHEVRHAGDAACATCHDDVAAAHDSGGHAAVRCELCHSVMTDHVAESEVIAPMPIAASLELCSRCHRALNARPGGFPQVNPRQHLADMDVDLSDDVCVECHDPHSPADL